MRKQLEHLRGPRSKLTAVAATLALITSGIGLSASAASAAPEPPETPVASAPVLTGASADSAAALRAKKKKKKVTTAALNLRKSPSASGKVIKVLGKGTRVTTIGSHGKWRKVIAGSRTGWVHGAYLKTAKSKVKKHKATITVTSRSKSKTSVGAKIVFKGKTSKNLVGKRVQLQIKHGSKWAKVSSKKVAANKTFRVAAKATKAGTQKYRLYASATKKTKAAKSKAYKYSVWKWYSIAGTEVDSTRLDGTDTRSVGGKKYRHSATFGWGPGGYNESGWADYNLNYRCTNFRATIGMQDNSQTGSKRTFSLSIDDTNVNFGTVGLGAGKPVTANVSGAYRIRLKSLTANNTWGLGVFGTPQVYCKAKP